YDRRRNRLFCASQQCLGEKGVDAIGLVQKMDACSFGQAIKKIKNFYGCAHESRGPKKGLSHVRSVGAAEASPANEARIDADVVRQALARAGFHAVAEYGYGSDVKKVRFEHESRQQEMKKRAQKTFRWEHRVNGTWRSGDGGLPKA